MFLKQRINVSESKTGKQSLEAQQVKYISQAIYKFSLL